MQATKRGGLRMMKGLLGHWVWVLVGVVGAASLAAAQPVKFTMTGEWRDANTTLGTSVGDPLKVEFSFDAADFVRTNVHPFGVGSEHAYSRGIEGPDLVVDPPTDPAFPALDNQGFTKFLSIDLFNDGSVILPRNKTADNDGDSMSEGAPGSPVRMELINNLGQLGINDWMILKDGMDLNPIGAGFSDARFGIGDIFGKEFTTTDGPPATAADLETLMTAMMNSGDVDGTGSNLAFTIGVGGGGRLFGDPLGIITSIQTEVIPEPATLGLMLIGLVGLIRRGRSR